MSDESRALVNIAVRLDRDSIRLAQTVARKAIRSKARAARIVNDGSRKGLTMSYRSEMERLRNERRETAASFKSALVQSNVDIASDFAATREAQAAEGNLGIAIAGIDALHM